MKKMNLIILLTSAIIWLSCSAENDMEKNVPTGNEIKPNENKGAFKYLALGDSYTIGQNVEENQRFPVQLVQKLNEAGLNVAKPTIVARTGWTTADLARGIEDANLTGTYDLVTLLIGVNNQYQGRDTAEYRKQFRELLIKSVGFANDIEKRVIVISIPDYGVTPFGSSNAGKIAEEIDVFNKINREETELRKVQYVYITSISRAAKEDSSLIAGDGLHPSGKMYGIWVQAIFPVANNILNYW
jgi:lysophospholipase L1-like esterase